MMETFHLCVRCGNSMLLLSVSWFTSEDKYTNIKGFSGRILRESLFFLAELIVFGEVCCIAKGFFSLA